MNKYESYEQVESIIKGMDSDGDGKVQLRELCGFLNQPTRKTRPEEEEACTWHTHMHMAHARARGTRHAHAHGTNMARTWHAHGTCTCT